MTGIVKSQTESQARVLLYSQRNPFANVHYRAGLYEFEDIICQLDTVDVVSPEPTRWFETGTRLANRLATSFGTTVNPGIRRATVQKDYDLFVAVAQFPKDLLHIKYLEGWKQRCRTSICWLNEIYVADIRTSRHFLSLLSDFDYVVLQQTGSLAPVQKLIRAKCSYFPSGVDALLFCPYPDPAKRVIDVYSIGRRSNDTHRSLLDMAAEKQIFYVYDSMKGDEIRDPQEHRFLYANMAKRSRYFIVNRGNVDKPGQATQVEFGNRFFEGAASGAIMIGETPRNEEFQKVFNWPDAVIDVPFGSDAIREVIDSLDRDPGRQDRIRTTNVTQSLLHHDWAYRWESALKLVGLQPTPELLARKRQLQHLAGIAADSCQLADSTAGISSS